MNERDLLLEMANRMHNLSAMCMGNANMIANQGHLTNQMAAALVQMNENQVRIVVLLEKILAHLKLPVSGEDKSKELVH